MLTRSEPEWMDLPLDLPPDILDDADPAQLADFEALINQLATQVELPGFESGPEQVDLTPRNAWERFQAATFDVNLNPDLAEERFMAEAVARGLYDARVVGFERIDPDGSVLGYSVGVLERCEESPGVTTGRYLEVVQLADLDEAMTRYRELDDLARDNDIPPYLLGEFARYAARESGLPGRWRDTSSDELEQVELLTGERVPLELADLEDADAASVPAMTRDGRGQEAFWALHAIGLQAEDFDPDADPPPFYDPATGAAYWIGIYQPDLTDPERCFTGILSLGRDGRDGELEARLALCAPGDMEQATRAGEHLLTVMEREGLDACFLAAESMAIATEQRERWGNERGMPLAQTFAEEAASYARETFDIEL